jgi:hypothetical protein
MVTAALLGLLKVAPAVGLDRATLKDLVPLKALAVLTGTEIVLDAASPSAQFNVPLVAV